MLKGNSHIKLKKYDKRRRDCTGCLLKPNGAGTIGGKVILFKISDVLG